MQLEEYLLALSTQPFVNFQFSYLLTRLFNFLKKKKTTFGWEKVKKIHQHVPLN